MPPSNRFQNRQNPESITEGVEMSIEVNSGLLTLLVTVLVLPFEMYVISASDFSAIFWWPRLLAKICDNPGGCAEDIG